MVDRQSGRTRQAAVGSVLSHDLSDLLLVIEGDDELVGIGTPGPYQTPIRNIIIDEGESQFFVIPIHQHSEFSSRRRRRSLLEGQSNHVPPRAPSDPDSYKLPERS